MMPLRLQKEVLHTSLKGGFVKNKQKLMEQAVAQGTGFTDLVPWVQQVTSWTAEQKEEKAKREIYCLLVRKLILAARKDFRENNLSVHWYMSSISQWKEMFSIGRCHNHDENHTHQWECGPCFECLGTGRTLLLFTSRKRGVQCIACNGSGVRNQEFEQSDFLIGDDLEGHLLELDEYQTQPAIDFISAASYGLHEEGMSAEFFYLDHDGYEINLYKLSSEIMEEDEKAEIAYQKELASYEKSLIDPELLRISRQILSEDY